MQSLPLTGRSIVFSQWVVGSNPILPPSASRSCSVTLEMSRAHLSLPAPYFPCYPGAMRYLALALLLSCGSNDPTPPTDPTIAACDPVDASRPEQTIMCTCLASVCYNSAAGACPLGYEVVSTKQPGVLCGNGNFPEENMSIVIRCH